VETTSRTKSHSREISFIEQFSIMAIFGVTRQYVFAAIPMGGFMLGWWLDRKETERMVRFRDKSALFGRELKPGEKPSWP
jgi:NADH dehydrogenase (ubiquinone) 1 beta subcomplex subunit 1